MRRLAIITATALAFATGLAACEEEGPAEEAGEAIEESGEELQESTD